jgi:hypothetical protein
MDQDSDCVMRGQTAGAAPPPVEGIGSGGRNANARAADLVGRTPAERPRFAERDCTNNSKEMPT